MLHHANADIHPLLSSSGAGLFINKSQVDVINDFFKDSNERELFSSGIHDTVEQAIVQLRMLPKEQQKLALDIDKKKAFILAHTFPDHFSEALALATSNSVVLEIWDDSGDSSELIEQYMEGSNDNLGVFTRIKAKAEGKIRSNLEEADPIDTLNLLLFPLGYRLDSSIEKLVEHEVVTNRYEMQSMGDVKKSEEAKKSEEKEVKTNKNGEEKSDKHEEEKSDKHEEEETDKNEEEKLLKRYQKFMDKTEEIVQKTDCMLESDITEKVKETDPETKHLGPMQKNPVSFKETLSFLPRNKYVHVDAYSWYCSCEVYFDCVKENDYPCHRAGLELLQGMKGDEDTRNGIFSFLVASKSLHPERLPMCAHLLAMLLVILNWEVSKEHGLVECYKIRLNEF